MSHQVTLEAIISLCKRRGFVYQSAELYGGLNGVYDFGHLGTLMRDNIRTAWKQSITTQQPNILFFDGALLGSHSMWEASGHVENFPDPTVDCLECKKRFRADEMDLEKPCPSCGNKKWTAVRQFNMMFKTQLGASAENASTAYLRPETAQSIFVNFKNIMSSNRVKIPFGIAQIGKAFRNEITPKQFLFRMREFEQMEMEWFCKEEDAPKFFESWLASRKEFYSQIGVKDAHITLHKHGQQELAHYSSQCTDVMYQFPFGSKELEGIADRGAFDLTQHAKHAGKELAIFDDQTKQSYVPHVIECSVGVDRLFLTLLFDAYEEEDVQGETRTVLKLHPRIAPIKAAFLPLTKKLSEPMMQIYRDIKNKLPLSFEFDEAGSIGKRYRRHDEIGTPFCFTYDFESAEQESVTVRSRDTMTQERIKINQIPEYLEKMGVIHCV